MSLKNGVLIKSYVGHGGAFMIKVLITAFMFYFLAVCYSAIPSYGTSKGVSATVCWHFLPAVQRVGVKKVTKLCSVFFPFDR